MSDVVLIINHLMRICVIFPKISQNLMKIENQKLGLYDNERMISVV